jgi:multiple sugar transport system ATP-binding protein
LRGSMRGEIRNLHDRLKTTTVYVTHDQVEAMTLADRVVLINEGAIQQVGTPLDIYDHPMNKFVAGFIGSPTMNFIDCEVTQKGPNIFLDGNSFQFPISAIKDGAEISHLLGKDVTLGLRPEDIQDREFARGQKEGIIKVTVTMVEPMGANVHLRVISGEHRMIACVDSKTQAKVGETIDLVCDLSKAHLFDKKTENAITKSTKPE